MNNIVETVNLFLENYGIKNSGKKVLLGFSGGCDSLCLLHILNTLKIPVAAIHLNHNWRGKESLQDELFCRNYCERNKIEFYSQTLSDGIPKTETAAREARYAFFKNCAEKFNTEFVLTAHNADDNAETVLYRIIKGTGVAGLSAIQERRGIFYRPLLNIYRCDIEDYCKGNELTPIIDSSNKNTKYKRNLIRQKILPLCDEINPKCKKVINSLSELAKNENELLEEYLCKIKSEIQNSTQKFAASSDAVQNRLIYDLFIEKSIDYDKKTILRIKNFILQNMHSKSGKKCSVTKNIFMFVNEEYFEIISKNECEKHEFKITKEGTYDIGDFIFSVEKTNKTPDKFPKDSDYTAYVNLDELNFTLRNRKEGDTIVPLGAKGSQKLKKYLNNKKIPNYKKDRILFLCRENEIFWAPGLGISNKIKVETAATHVLKLVKKEG